jgi:ATP-dependent DNA ligase
MAGRRKKVPQWTQRDAIARESRRQVGENEHMEKDGPTVFAHACKLGLEGIVSKRRDSRYRSGRSPDWLKSKNPACEAVRREANRPGRNITGVTTVSAELEAKRLGLPI